MGKSTDDSSGEFIAWQRKIKRGALVEGAPGPDAAAVAVDDALDGCQADAGALKLALVMEFLEQAEQPVSVGWIKSDAVIAHKKTGFGASSKSKFDEGVWVPGSEFPGVFQKTFQHQP